MPDGTNPANKGTAKHVYRSLLIQLRVIFALVLREARSRHGRSRLGYAWTIVEPTALILFLTLMFSQFRQTTGPGGSFAMFFATGILPFQMFRNMAQYGSHAIIANQPLFNYPLVKPIDALIARAVLEFCTALVVMAVVLGFQILALGAPMPYSPSRLLLVLGLLAALGFGTAICLAHSQKVFASTNNVFAIIMGPAFFVSGVFFSLQSVPETFRKYLVWNPLLHAIEGFRWAFFPEYRNPDLDLVYLFGWGFGLIFIGLLAYRLMRKTET